MSKGSNVRPKSVSRQNYEANWDKIFGKKAKEEEKQPKKKTK